jgi:hypothetical protein
MGPVAIGAHCWDVEAGEGSRNDYLGDKDDCGRCSSNDYCQDCSRYPDT